MQNNRRFTVEGREKEKYKFMQLIPLDEYVRLKKQDAFHMDYLLKKEIVMETNKRTLHLLDLKSKHKNKDSVYLNTKPRTRKDIEKNIFDTPPIEQYKKLCNDLGWEDHTLHMKVEGNMVVGLGDSNVNETSMTIHHTYGIPYIPAQAVKGMLRNYLIAEYKHAQKESIDIKGCPVEFKELCRFIFGEDHNQKKQKEGDVIFFDAFPCKEITIARDVMTPHYAQYYTGNGCAPTDTENPVPILFYVVKDTNFAFHYAVCKDLTVENEKVQASKLKGFIHDTLEAALREFGIGAKTSVGYGHFIKSDQGETGKK